MEGFFLNPEEKTTFFLSMWFSPQKESENENFLGMCQEEQIFTREEKINQFIYFPDTTTTENIEAQLRGHSDSSEHILSNHNQQECIFQFLKEKYHKMDRENTIYYPSLALAINTYLKEKSFINAYGKYALEVLQAYEEGNKEVFFETAEILSGIIREPQRNYFCFLFQLRIFSAMGWSKDILCLSQEENCSLQQRMSAILQSLIPYSSFSHLKGSTDQKLWENLALCHSVIFLKFQKNNPLHLFNLENYQKKFQKELRRIDTLGNILSVITMVENFGFSYKNICQKEKFLSKKSRFYNEYLSDEENINPQEEEFQNAYIKHKDFKNNYVRAKILNNLSQERYGNFREDILCAFERLKEKLISEEYASDLQALDILPGKIGIDISYCDDIQIRQEWDRNYIYEQILKQHESLEQIEQDSTSFCIQSKESILESLDRQLDNNCEKDF